MNKPRLHSIEIDPDDIIVKKDSYELKVTTYINKVHILFRWLSHKNFMVSLFFLEQSS